MSSCRRSARSTTRPTIWCSSISRSSAFPDQPLGRSILGTRETVRSFDGKRLRAYLGRHYRAPDMVVAAAGAVDHDDGRRRGRAALRAASPGAGGAAPEPARFGGGAHVEKRELEQVHIALALQGVPQRDPVDLQPAGVHQRARRRHVIAAVSGSAREARALLLDLRVPCAPIRTPACSALYAGTDAADAAGADAGRGRRDRRHGGDHLARPRSPAPRRR